VDSENKKTILLVEDEFLLAMTEQRALEDYGYAVQNASTGEKAVEIINKANSIDLILMDINLGNGMDGTQAAGQILKDHDIPIVFVSSHSEREVVTKTESITSYGYVLKSSSITVLDASIKMAFKLFEANRSIKIINDKLVATVDALPDLLFEVGLDGYYYHVYSPHSEKLYKPASDLVGKKIAEVLPRESSDIMMSAIMEAHQTGLSIGKQYALIIQEVMRWFELSVSRIASYPDMPHFILLARDITTRKNIEEELKESAFRLSRAEKIARIGNWKLNLDTNVIIGSPGASYIYGLTENELSFDAIHEMVLPEYRDKSDAAIKSLISSGAPYNLISKIKRRSDGKTIDVHSMADYYRETNTILGVIEDITEQKKLEERLLTSNEMFQKVLDSIPQFIAWKDRESVFLGCNENYARMAGLADSKSIIGKTDWDLPWREAETEKFLHDDRSVMAMDKPIYHMQEPAFDADGKKRILDTSKVPLHDIDGKVYGILIAFEDITDRMKNERLLYENKNMLRHILDTIPQSVFWKDTNSVFLGCNESFARTMGLRNAEEIDGKNDFDITALRVNAERFIADDRLVISTKSAHAHIIEQVGKNHKNAIWVDTTKLPLLDNDNKVYGVLGVFDDFTERKRTEDLLRGEQQRLHDVLTVTNTGIWEWNIQTGEVVIDEVAAGLLGYGLRELEPITFDTWLALKHPDDRKQAHELLQKIVRGELESYEFDSRMRHKSGNWVWIHGRGKIAERDGGGTPIRMFGTHIDISERKKIEEALKASEEKFRAITERSSEGTLLIDEVGDIVVWNPAMERLSGISAAEALGHPMWEIQPRMVNSTDRARLTANTIRQVFSKALETGQSSRFNRSIEANIETVHLERKTILQNSFCFKTSRGYQIGVVINDITEFKRAEREINKLLAEKETVLKEVHHRIKNNMNTIHSLLSLQALSLKDPAAKNILIEACNQVRSMTILYDRLTYSIDFTNLPIRAYLQPLIEEIIHSFPNGQLIEIRQDIEELTLSAKTLQTLGIIANEVITNSMKYAFCDNRKGAITIKAGSSGGIFTLSIHDSGAGIPEAIDFGHSPGFGLALIEKLSRQIDAAIRIERSGGTRVVIEMPLARQ